MPITTLPVSPAGELNHNDVRTKINTVIDEVNLQETQGDTNEADITTLQGEMVTAQSDILANAVSIASNAGDITTLQSQMVTAQTDISTLQALVALPPTNIETRQDAIDNGTLLGSEITLNQGAYLMGQVDLGSDSLIVEGGTVLIGTTSELSSITSSAAAGTVIFRNGGFVASGMIGQAGIKINNTSTGASIKCQDAGTIVFFSNLFTNSGALSLWINNASGIALNNYTVLNGTNGILMTGAANAGPIIRGFNPISLSGKGIDIQGDITSGALRINDAQITSDGNGVEISGDIQGLEFSGDSISTNGNGLKISGNVPGGASISKTNIQSLNQDAMDITGSLLSSLIMNQAGVTAIAAGKFGLKGDANSANITNAAIVTSSFIDGIGAGGGALSGITKKDIKWSFLKAGPKITDSRNIGAIRLNEASAQTTFTVAGSNKTITAYADAGGGVTTVTSAAHGLSNGAVVSITGTEAYDGIFTISGVTASTFNINRAFDTDEATGVAEVGWVKLGGVTTTSSIIERFSQSDNNELTSLDPKTLPLTYSAVINGLKSGATVVNYEFALFQDDADGNGFHKINGSLPADFSNRGSSLLVRVPTEVPTNGKLTTYIRNMEGTNAFDLIGFSVDVGLS